MTETTFVKLTTKQINKHKAAEWFQGLNSLRFFAALLVVIQHIHANQLAYQAPHLPNMPIFFKGTYAVYFFFVLSGFLITHLFMIEVEHHESIDVKRFYFRRMLRIWPPYFFVIVAGLFFYFKIVPVLGLKFESAYPLSLAIALYSLFLANLMNSLYKVGGILNLTWSIAVEEQFYLIWAPCFKKFSKNALKLISVVFLLSLLVYEINLFNIFHISEPYVRFIGTLQFHYMAAGAFFAWALQKRREKMLNLIVFRIRGLQALLYFIIISFLLFYQKQWIAEVFAPLILAPLFGWLIINTSLNSKRLISLEYPVLSYLGKVSYGVYMYHTFAIYLVAFCVQKWFMPTRTAFLYFSIYYLSVISITVALATISFYLMERPILKMKRR